MYQNTNNDKFKALSSLGLTKDQTILLYALERYIVTEDIKLTINKGGNGVFFKDKDQEDRYNWLREWEIDIKLYLASIEDSDSKLDSKSFFEYDTSDELYSAAYRVKTSLKNNMPLYLILLEISIFTPYYELYIDSKSDYEKEKYKKQNEIWSKLEFNSGRLEDTYKEIARILGISFYFIEKYRDTYKSSVNSLTGYWKKMLIGGAIGVAICVVTAGIAAPYVIAAAAPLGLSGAAAFSAGLAALGGGTVAAGGLGMAGGCAVLVGGGGILSLTVGGGLGGGIGTLFASSPEMVVSQSAKLEVVCKEILLSQQKDTVLFQEIFKQQSDQISYFKSEYIKLKIENKDQKEKLKNLEKIIEYMEESNKNIQGFV